MLGCWKWIALEITFYRHWEIVMRTLQLFCGMCVATALLGASVVVAGITNELKPLEFSVSTEDGSVNLPDVRFDSVGSSGGGGALGTCMMTPGETMPIMLLELPTPRHATPERVTGVSDPGFSPVSWSSTPSASYNPYNPNNLYIPNSPNNPGVSNLPEQPPTGSEQLPVVVVPEPATLLIVALGIAGVTIVRRLRQEGK